MPSIPVSSGAAEPYCYIFVRDDLSWPQKIVQSSHASLELARQGLVPKDIPTPNFVLCKASDEEELLKIAARLDSEGVRHYLFTEPDIENQSTALITEPVYGDKRRMFRRYQCLRENA